MFSNYSNLVASLFMLLTLSTALKYELKCDYGMKAAQCAATYGSYCTPQGKLVKPGSAGTDCTTNRSPGPHGGAYCYCKFIYVPPPKPANKFNPNEILQQREEAVVPLPTPTFDPTEILQWTRDFEERADAVVHSRPLARPTFNPNDILQWTRNVEKRAEAADDNLPLPTPTFDPTEILQWTREVEERADAGVRSRPIARPTFNPNDILQWTRNNEKRADAIQEGYPLPTPTFDPTEILQWTRNVKENSELEHEARNGHIEKARQLPTSEINAASSSIAGALSSTLLGLTSTSMPSTTMMSATSKSSASPTSTVTPVLPPKSGAAGREVTGVLGLLGAFAIGFVAVL